MKGVCFKRQEVNFVSICTCGSFGELTDTSAVPFAIAGMLVTNLL